MQSCSICDRQEKPSATTSGGALAIATLAIAAGRPSSRGRSGQSPSQAAALTQVNDAIMKAIASRLPALEFEFDCECGASDCDVTVALSAEEYVAAHDRGDPVFAPGHRVTEVGHAKQARKDAKELRDSAKALRAEAKQQAARARRNRPPRSMDDIC